MAKGSSNIKVSGKGPIDCERNADLASITSKHLSCKEHCPDGSNHMQ